VLLYKKSYGERGGGRYMGRERSGLRVCSGCLQGGGRVLVRIFSVLNGAEMLLIVKREVLESVGEGRSGVGVCAKRYPAVIEKSSWTHLETFTTIL
jgi:hypothetical protein